ncbi:MAG TPA: hypothetical protein VGE29_17535 [Prosthecobacter sp.]
MTTSDYCKLALYIVVFAVVIPFLAGFAKGLFPEYSNTIQIIKVLATLGVGCLAWWQSKRGQGESGKLGQKPGADTEKDPEPASDQAPSA